LENTSGFICKILLKIFERRFLIANSVVQTKLNRHTMMCNMECSSNPYVDPVVIPIELDERFFISEVPEMLGLLYL
jgi:hypothetical protein